MDEKRLDEIKKRAELATPAPWNHDTEYYIHDPNPVLVASIRQSLDDYELICEIRYPRQDSNSANIDFIAHARQDIPDLLEEIERLTAENADLKAVIGNLRRAISPSVEL